jgi:hypothetical protein
MAKGFLGCAEEQPEVQASEPATPVRGDIGIQHTNHTLVVNPNA